MDFIFGMHTPLLLPFQVTPNDLDLYTNNSFLDFDYDGGILFYKHILFQLQHHF